MFFKLLIPFAIFGYLWFLVTLLSGLKVIKVSYKTHRLLGIVAVALATIHAVIMIYLNYWS